MNATPNGMHASVEARNRANLLRRVDSARRLVEDAKDVLRETERAYDDFELRNRPKFPTTAQRIALEAAVEDVKDGFAPPSHLGRHVDAGVVAHGEKGFISIDADAPYGRFANGRLWDFTDEEVNEIISHVVRLGVNVKEFWMHERGLSMTVAVA